jgi:citrate lyase alpha subunit
MPYPESIGIDRVDQIVTVDTITNDAVQLKIFAFQNLSAATAGSRSITNSLIGSENFFVAGTGTDGATVLSAYWF